MEQIRGDQAGKTEVRKVRYLEQWEKQKTKPMYQAIFPEDSHKFVDYYYKWKTKDNEILVMEQDDVFEEGSFSVMIHFNPYTLCINGTLLDIPYIVAVATYAACRRQGRMGQVMRFALRDMEQKQIPFSFLLPADPAYYKGQGFVFFPCQDPGICMEDSRRKDCLYPANRGDTESQQTFQNREISAATADHYYLEGDVLASGLQWKRADTEDIPAMVSFSNKVLEQRDDIFINRDAAYYERLFAETAAENGGVLLLQLEGELYGLMVYGVAEQADRRKPWTAEVKELLLESVVSREDAKKLCQIALAGIHPKWKQEESLQIAFMIPNMMVRIINLPAFVSLMRSEGRHSFYVKVKDSIIEANNGTFLIETDHEGGRIQRIMGTGTGQERDISELAEELLERTSVYLNEWV